MSKSHYGVTSPNTKVLHFVDDIKAWDRAVTGAEIRGAAERGVLRTSCCDTQVLPTWKTNGHYTVEEAEGYITNGVDYLSFKSVCKRANVMSNERTVQVKVAVLIPRGPGRPDPKTATKVYEVVVDHEDPNVRLGLASVEAIRIAEEAYGTSENSNYPYTISVEEKGTER